MTDATGPDATAAVSEVLDCFAVRPRGGADGAALVAFLRLQAQMMRPVRELPLPFAGTGHVSPASVGDWLAETGPRAAAGEGAGR